MSMRADRTSAEIKIFVELKSETQTDVPLSNTDSKFISANDADMHISFSRMIGNTSQLFIRSVPLQ